MARLLRPALIAVFSLAVASLLIAGSHSVTGTADNQTGRPDQTVLQPTTTLSSPDGAVSRTIGNTYLSPITEANTPFTHMLLRWEAFEPVSDTLTLEVRASADNQSWSEWGPVLEDPDMWVPRDGDEVYWSQIIYAGEDARFWQVRATMQPAPDGQLPLLRQIDINTVDARFGDPAPTPELDLGTTRGITPAGIGRPPVVSRTSWGSPDGQSSRVRPAYYPVNHMVVHHTADANSLRGGEQNWAGRVRAIWSFHTYTRGWGDVGYNYLIDPNGVIYEGRSGGDDAVAFHDTGNYGSMGVVVIGTYANVPPTAASQDRLVELLAWKAAQKGIDPLGRSYYYGCDISNFCRPHTYGAVVANIAGHRQVTPGHTTCPGDAFLNLLPNIRNRVKSRLDSGGNPARPDNGDLLIDELEENSFAYSPANWYSAGCGYGGHTFYTYATDNPGESSNSATWRPNIPAGGSYRVFAHIPQGCGLGAPPYATTKARYHIHAADGDFYREVDHNTAEEWVDLGVYQFNAGSEGAVQLNDLTGEAYSRQRVIFFDSIKWVPDNQARAELLNVHYDRTSVTAGEVLKVTFTVRNSGKVPIHGQDPEAGTLPDGHFDPGNGYTYDEQECFQGANGQNYPIYPKQTDRFRVMLGPTDRGVPCDGTDGGYPWRWGLNGTLQPGETRDIIGYIRFRQSGNVTLQAGIIQEYVDYHVQGAAATPITVTPERLNPITAAYDLNLQPLAHVYQLGAIPDNLLARTRNPLSITRGAYVGSFPWDGHTLEWGGGGPFDQSDSFLVEQTRVFLAPRDGEYTFRTTSDDGSWLWVDGQAVVVNHGLHHVNDSTGTIYLNAGPHVLSFKYFERTGLATAGYAMQMPGSAEFTIPRDGTAGGAFRIGSTFATTPDLTLVADDLGGTGVAHLRYSWDGNTWIDSPGGILRLGRLVNGHYHLRYQAVDHAGNRSAIQELPFVVDTTIDIEQVYLPLVNK